MNDGDSQEKPKEVITFIEDEEHWRQDKVEDDELMTQE